MRVSRQVEREGALLLIVIAVLFVLVLFWLMIHLLLRGRSPELIMISHRGAAGLAPENTLAAIRRGIAEGATHIEVDVQRSADGVLLLLHDTTLDRTTDGQGPVREASWDEIQRLDAGSWFAPEFAGERIPSLDAAFSLLDSWPGTLILEAKDPALYPGMVEDMAHALEEHDVESRVQVVSFDHDWLAAFQHRLPTVSIGRLNLWVPPFSGGPAATSTGVYWPAVLIDPTLIWRIHGRGERIWVWTVNDPALMRLIAWLGVDGITTDHPERWPFVVGSLASAP